MKQNFSLVLGGGSARGIAHIGIIRRLEELNQKPNLIIGTSMGALVGAFYACGYNSEEMSKISTDVEILSMIDPDFENGGLKGEKAMKFFEKHFKDKTFDDCVIPLKIIATDLNTGKKIVFTDGRLADAIRASVSIPGVFVPHKYRGMELVDGGVVANLAVEEANKEDKILAISVQIPLQERYEERKKREKKKKLISFENPIRNSYRVMQKTLGIMIITNEKISLKKRPDTYFLRLERPELDYIDFNKAAEFIEAGYKLAEGIEDFFKKKSFLTRIFGR